MTDKVTITRERLVDMFRNFKKEVSFSGVTFLKVVYANDVAGSRTINKKKALTKITEAIITVGASYEKKINKIAEVKQQMGDVDFKAQKMLGKFYKYGVDVPVVASEKKPDFEMLVMMIEQHQRKNRSSVYFYNGKPISIADANEKNLLQPSFFKAKPTAGRGVVNEENDFDINTLGFDKIVSIKVNNTVFKVEN